MPIVWYRPVNQNLTLSFCCLLGHLSAFIRYFYIFALIYALHIHLIMMFDLFSRWSFIFFSKLVKISLIFVIYKCKTGIFKSQKFDIDDTGHCFFVFITRYYKYFSKNLIVSPLRLLCRTRRCFYNSFHDF